MLFNNELHCCAFVHRACQVKHFTALRSKIKADYLACLLLSSDLCCLVLTCLLQIHEKKLADLDLSCAEKRILASA